MMTLCCILVLLLINLFALISYGVCHLLIHDPGKLILWVLLHYFLLGY
jgi:hypothetical protein